MVFLDSGIPSSQDFDRLQDQLAKMSAQLEQIARNQKQQPSNIEIAEKKKEFLGCTATKSITLDEEDILNILQSKKSIDKLLKLLPDFESVATGLKCNTCNVIIAYDFNKGCFFENSGQPREFINLKAHICRHLKSLGHIQKTENAEKYSQLRAAQLQNAKEDGVNCASIAYQGYYFSSSYRSYENAIATCHSSGGSVGYLNHSREFPRKFMPSVYNVLRGDLSNFITQQQLPFGVLADKMTVNHRTRHIVGIRIPIWDIRYSTIVKDVYIQSSSVKLSSGKDICNHLFESLESAGFSSVYSAKNISGLAMDGQYTKLNIRQHTEDKFDCPINLSWDPMHQIQLVYNDSSNLCAKNFINETVELITAVTKQFKSGKTYESLLEIAYPDDPDCNLLTTLLSPKLFKKMKFVAYSRSVFDTFINNYPAYVASAEQLEDDEDHEYLNANGMRDRLMSYQFICDLLFLRDVCSQMAECSTKSQLRGLLPWEYPLIVEDLSSNLNSMLECIGSVRD